MRTRESGPRFRRVATFATHAASGLATVETSSGLIYLAVANYYSAASPIFAIDASTSNPRSSVRVERVQTVRTSAAHDITLVEGLNGRTQLVIANYVGDTSVVLQLRAGGASTEQVIDLQCFDAHTECSSWAQGGECQKNRGFMEAECAASCGCSGEGTPFAIVQHVPTRGACAVHHIPVQSLTSAGQARHLLAVANAHDGVNSASILEWHEATRTWRPWITLPVEGASEFAHTVLPNGELVLAVASWFAQGTFVTRSRLFTFRTDGSGFDLMGEVVTRGAHDVEFFTAHVAPSVVRTGLIIANVRDDATQFVPSLVLELNLSHGTSIVQEVPSLGAHDVHVVQAGDRRLVLVANQGDGSSCNATVDMHEVVPGLLRLQHIGELTRATDGCAVYVHSFKSSRSGRLFVAVAIEKTDRDRKVLVEQAGGSTHDLSLSTKAYADTDDSGSAFRTDSLLFEWKE